MKRVKVLFLTHYLNLYLTGKNNYLYILNFVINSFRKNIELFFIFYRCIFINLKWMNIRLLLISKLFLDLKLTIFISISFVYTLT